jgi:hypothetical protein
MYGYYNAAISINLKEVYYRISSKSKPNEILTERSY